jgi:hypothetical protein
VLSCPKALQVWVRDKSQLTFVVVVAAVILTINKKAYVHLVDSVRLHVCASINGAREIALWVVNNLVLY